MNSLRQSTAQKLLIITNLVIPIKFNVSKFTIQVPETNLGISEVNNYHLKEPADDLLESTQKGKHMHDQSHIRDKRQTKERRIEGSNSIIVLGKILIQCS